MEVGLVNVQSEWSDGSLIQDLDRRVVEEVVVTVFGLDRERN